MEHLDNEYWNRSAKVAFSFDDEDFTSGGEFFNEDNISEASFDNSSTIGVLNFSIKSIINDDAMIIVLQEQSLDDRIVPKGILPEEELKLLRRQIQTALYSPSQEASSYKLLVGKITPLELFRSLHDKQQLLDTVLENGGGDSVIGVLLFLKKSLNRDFFLEMLQKRSKALTHFLSYLKQSGCLAEQSGLLHTFGKHQEAYLLQLELALVEHIHDARMRKLLQLNENYTTQSSVISLYKQIFIAARMLYEFLASEQRTFGGENRLLSTPIEVLYASCQKNNNWNDKDMVKHSSPHRFCAEQKICAAQFEWVMLNERARAEAFGDLQTIFEHVSTWHPLKSKQFYISFSLALAVQRLHKLQVPASVLYLFLSKMNNNGEKLILAQRVKCIKGEIDAMVGLKHVAELAQLMENLPERSEEIFYCENALKKLQNKRWTTDNIKLKL